jgi:thioredoxin-like negative regulator of GroEL
MDIKVFVLIVLAILVVAYLLVPSKTKQQPPQVTQQQNDTGITPVDLPQPEEKQIEQQQPREPVPVILFHATWCPHCTSLVPLWDSLTPQMRNIVAKKVESKDPDMAYHNIKSFPTIRAFPQGLDQDYIEYSGDRTPQDLEHFLGSF